MCGRIATYFTKDDVVDYFSLDKIIGDLRNRYNVGPMQKIPVVVHGSRIMDFYKWGLVPFWSKDVKIGNKMINARAETLLEKKSFSVPFKGSRCLIAVSGFYEWKNKTPNYIYLKDKKVFALAGLYSTFVDEQTKEKIKTVCIITCSANSFMEEIHHRMPVIIDEKYFDEWINPQNFDVDNLKKLLIPYPSDKMISFEVSNSVNNIRNDSEDLIKPTSKKQTTLK